MTHHKKALQFAREGKWDEAHELVQPHTDKLSCLIHAWLHREEGDNANAAYWYREADSAFPDNDLDEEWERLYRMVADDS